MLSQRTRYAIRALLHLGDRYGEGPVQLTEIAEAQNIPAKFLTVILSEMKRAGLVETLRGKEGGYWLARPPEQVTYGEIVRLTRGSLALVPCAARLAYTPCENCVDEATLPAARGDAVGARRDRARSSIRCRCRKKCSFDGIKSWARAALLSDAGRL